MRILIVDDDEIARCALRRILTEAGYEVHEAQDGLEALGLVRTGDFRLIISDWVMPGMDGLELCRHIRDEELPHYVYVILLTSHDESGAVVEGMSAGADDFITKPFDANELRVRVRSAERVLGLDTRDVAIFALAKLAESRDPDTGAHLERVRTYSRIIAKHLEFQKRFRELIDAEYVRMIFLTSPLHDIGKVGIPDFVLLKPGKLNEREWNIMKTHPTLGAETLDAALRQYPGVPFLEMGRDIALTHHERFNGEGYPQGLTGYDIPLSGRIVALADVYDALCSQRSYKQAYTHEVARDIIVDEAGKHFDPDVVNAFLDNEEEFIAVRERYAETALIPV